MILHLLKGGEELLPPRVVSKFVPEPNTGCWLWIGEQRDGYGRIWNKGGKRTTAHIFIFETLVGPVPDGYLLDHLCRQHACVNPYHLEPVPSWLNTYRGNGPSAQNMRKMHCARGHLYTVKRSGIGRWCQTCKNEQRRAAKALQEQNALQATG